MFSRMELDFATIQLPLDPCSKKKIYQKYIFLLSESFKALLEDEDQMSLVALNLAQAFERLPVDSAPLTISRQILKNVSVSVTEIIDRLSKIEDGGQRYGSKEMVGKLQDPELLTADLEFCGSILFDSPFEVFARARGC
jgi:hypothetical protein